MIVLRIRVPIACWRKSHAREFMETEMLPPPATCYGALLSMVGETDRERHRGCRVTAGIFNRPEVSTVLRTFWRIKSATTPQGEGENAKPDYQQLVIDADLLVFCDSAEEVGALRLEQRVLEALVHPEKIERFGGWSLGESTHLINDVQRVDGEWPNPCRTFLVRAQGAHTLPIWVDHVGSEGTRYAVGDLVSLTHPPATAELPQIPFEA